MNRGLVPWIITRETQHKLRYNCLIPNTNIVHGWRIFTTAWFKIVWGIISTFGSCLVLKFFKLPTRTGIWVLYDLMFRHVYPGLIDRKPDPNLSIPSEFTFLSIFDCYILFFYSLLIYLFLDCSLWQNDWTNCLSSSTDLWIFDWAQ